ncbi:MAG: WYL domain-containing protein [Cyanobacteria bacterium J06635_10]
MKLLRFVFTVLWGLGYLGNGILFISIEWSFLQQSFIQIFNPFLHFQVFGVLLTAHLFWVFLTMAVVGSYAVSIIERHLAQAAEQAEFHAAKAVYKSPQSFQQRKLSSPLPSVRSPQPDSYVPPQTFRKPVSKVETESVEPQVKLLKWAIQSNQKVRFSYETRNGEKSKRTVTPINFKTVEQTLCLESYCHLRNAKRSFALKRMRDIEIISASQANYEQVISSGRSHHPMSRQK